MRRLLQRLPTLFCPMHLAFFKKYGTLCIPAVLFVLSLCPVEGCGLLWWVCLFVCPLA